MRTMIAFGFVSLAACSAAAPPSTGSMPTDVVVESTSPFATWSEACQACVVDVAPTCDAASTFQFTCPNGCTPPILASANCSLGLPGIYESPSGEVRIDIQFCCAGDM